jgi:hypothetical protein
MRLTPGGRWGRGSSIDRGLLGRRWICGAACLCLCQRQNGIRSTPTVWALSNQIEPGRNRPPVAVAVGPSNRSHDPASRCARQRAGSTSSSAVRRRSSDKPRGCDSRPSYNSSSQLFFAATSGAIPSGKLPIGPGPSWSRAGFTKPPPHRKIPGPLRSIDRRLRAKATVPQPAVLPP